MALPTKLIKKLEEKKIKHQILPHRKVYTALDAAATLKVKLEQVVKTLLIKAGNDFYLALLPANKNLDFKKIAKVLNVDSKKLSLPKEKVMTEKFKVKPGTMGAFGSLYKIPVVLDGSLTKIKEGIFATGSFVESLKMKVKDFLNLENPVLGNFSVAKKIKRTPPSSRYAGLRRAGKQIKNKKSKTRTVKSRKKKR